MNGFTFSFAGTTLTALPSGALYWADEGLLCVSDLHLGKSGRIARRTGTLLPPYEVQDTLTRLQSDIETTQATTVVCLGDSFDDLAAARSIDEDTRLWLTRLQAGRRWIWVEGNHDPGPVDLGGAHLAELTMPPVTFRHIAEPAAQGELSGHYHPKATVILRGRAVTRRCFLVDENRIVLPAYGTYTGGLRSHDPMLGNLMAPDARALLLGKPPMSIPMPRIKSA